MHSSASFRTSRTKIPLYISRFELDLQSQSNFKSVSELANFPFASFADFLHAAQQNKVFFELRRDYRLLWLLCSWRDRVFFSLCAQIGFVVAAGVLITALVSRDAWLLLSIPAFLLANWFAVPSPGCFHGLLPAVVGFASLGVGLMWHVPSAPLSLMWMFPWIIASFGSAIAAEVTIDALQQSEPILIWAIDNRSVSVRAIA